MINTIADKPQLGDLVMNWDGEMGIISLIETDKFMCPYFVRWTSGYLTGYSTAHKIREIKAWTINVRLNT